MPGPQSIRFLGDPEAVAREAAAQFSEAVRTAVSERGLAFVALAGGSTPRRAYEILASPEAPGIPWDRVRLLAGDERDVPSDHPERNERMIRTALLDRLPGGPASLLSWPIGEGTPDEAAARMEAELRRAFGTEPGAVPRFDLVLLGMGADGHTASLFPGSPALDERVKLVAANPVPSLGAIRYTLTFPAIENARKVVFLLAGAGKSEAFRRVWIEGPASGLPAARARSEDGETIWLVDSAVATGPAPAR